MDRFDLVSLKLRAGLRQYQLASPMGVTQTWLCDVQRGRRPITEEIQQGIVKLINVWVGGATELGAEVSEATPEDSGTA